MVCTSAFQQGVPQLLPAAPACAPAKVNGAECAPPCPALSTSCTTSDSTGSDFTTLSNVEPGLRSTLQRLHDEGVQVPARGSTPARRYSLQYGGEVCHDGSCFFTAVERALGGGAGGAAVLRAMAVARFRADVAAGIIGASVDDVIANLYAPELSRGWGVHFIQEVKLLLARKDEQGAAEQISALAGTGMDAQRAAETVYREVCTRVADRESWAAYLAVDGSDSCENRIVTLRYVEEGLLSAEVDDTAAFADDLAIESLATELGRHIYVVQAHGSDADSGASGALFFLPHAPRGEGRAAAADAAAPLFLLMKGAGWTMSGGDHLEPLIAVKMQHPQGEPAFTLD